MCDINKKFSVRYYLNLVLLDEDDRRYFKQHVMFSFICWLLVFVTPENVLLKSGQVKSEVTNGGIHKILMEVIAIALYEVENIQKQ